MSENYKHEQKDQSADTGAEIEVNESVAEEQALQPEKKKFNWKKELWEWTYTLGIAIIAVLIINNFVLTMVMVSGHSMDMTLSDGERLVVLHQNIAPIQQKDIVVFRPEIDPDRPYIKRVVAVAGQTIDVVDGKVLIDGIVLDEPYITKNTLKYTTSLPLTVDEGCIFVMGDNRDNSTDSRYAHIGQVELSTVIGKAVFRWFPFNGRFGTL